MKALDIRLALFGEQNADVATSYNNVGCAYGSLGQYEKALEYLRKALAIRKALFGESSVSTVKTRTNIDRICERMGNRHE